MSNETYEEWEGRLKKTCGEARGANFKIGDCLIEGELSYGERYSQALEETGLRYDTLAHIKYVASRVQVGSRVENLSFSHHRAVAHLSPEDQKRWLLQAKEANWTIKQFRALLKGGVEAGKKCAACRQETSVDSIKRVPICKDCLERFNETR